MKNLLIIIILAVLAGGGYYISTQQSRKASSAGNMAMTDTHTAAMSPAMSPAMTPAMQDAQTAAAPMFADSPDAKSAYPIFPGALTGPAKLALQNFTMTTAKNSDGSTAVTLTPKSNEEQKQSYTVKTGETLYFVEKFMADDSADADRNLKDDYGIVVSADGHIVSQGAGM